MGHDSPQWTSTSPFQDPAVPAVPAVYEHRCQPTLQPFRSITNRAQLLSPAFNDSVCLLGKMTTFNGDTYHALRAEYQCHGDSASFTEDIAPLPTHHSTDAKTKYISSLRASVTKLQADVNSFLTRKMEKEKVNSISDVKPVNDEKAEQDYGEEIVDDV